MIKRGVLLLAMFASTVLTGAPHWSYAVPISGYAFSGNGSESTAGATSGFRFKPNQPIRITSLGVVDSGAPGLAIDHPVGLWTDSGVLLASAVVPAGDGAPLIDGFRYVNIDPIQLDPEQTYRVGALFVFRTADSYFNRIQRTAPPQIMLLDPGRKWSTVSPNLAFPATSFNSEAAAANFRFEPDSAAPGTLLLDTFDDDQAGAPPNGPEVGTAQYLIGNHTVFDDAGDLKLRTVFSEPTSFSIQYTPTSQPLQSIVSYTFRVDPGTALVVANAINQQLIFNPPGSNLGLRWGNDLRVRYWQSPPTSPPDSFLTDFVWSLGTDYHVQWIIDGVNDRFSITINDTTLVSNRPMPNDFDVLRNIVFGSNIATSGSHVLNDVSVFVDAAEACDIGTFPVGPANCVAPPSQVNEAQGTLSVAMKWSCLGGAPACDDPSLVNEANVRDMLLRRQERAAQCIWLPQCNITLRSAATETIGLPGQFVEIEDRNDQIGDLGDVVIATPSPGQPADQSELLETWDAAAAAWGDVNKGVVAVSVNRIISPVGLRLARALVLRSPDTGNGMGAMVTTPWLLVQDPSVMCEANERTLAKMIGRLLSLPKGNADPNNLMSAPAINEEDSGVLLTAQQCQQVRDYLATPEGLVLDPPLSVTNETGEFFSDQVYDGLEDSVPQDEKYLDVLNSVVLDNGASEGEVVFCSGLGGLIPEQGPQGQTEPICVAFALDCDNNVNTGDNAGQVVPGLDFPGAEFVAELLVDRSTGRVIPVLNAATGFGFIEIEFEPDVFEGESVIGFVQVVDPTPLYDGPEFIPLTTEMRATLNSQLFADALADMGIEADETGRTFPAGLRFQVTTSQGSGQSAVDTNPTEKEELEFEETVFPQLIVPRRVRRGETVTVSVTGMPPLVPLRAVGGTFTALIEPVVTDDEGSATFALTVPGDAPLGIALVTIGVADESTAVTADGVLRVLSCPADLDGSGDLTVFDFLSFQNAWQAGQANADYDGDGELTVFDFLAFQNAFEIGCP